MLGDLNTPEDVERKRSVAMLSPGSPAYDREETLDVREALAAALVRVTPGSPRVTDWYTERRTSARKADRR